MSYSPAAQFLLFLVQWTDCSLAGALGLLRILIYKVLSSVRAYCFVSSQLTLSSAGSLFSPGPEPLLLVGCACRSMWMEPPPCPPTRGRPASGSSTVKSHTPTVFFFKARLFLRREHNPASASLDAYGLY
jgi:hypothetical protein